MGLIHKISIKKQRKNCEIFTIFHYYKKRQTPDPISDLIIDIKKIPVFIGNSASYRLKFVPFKYKSNMYTINKEILTAHN